MVISKALHVLVPFAFAIIAGTPEVASSQTAFTHDADTLFPVVVAQQPGRAARSARESLPTANLMARRQAQAPAAPAATPAAQAPERKSVTAVKVAPEDAIKLDGIFDEPVWARAQPATTFVQQDPLNGAPPTEPTEVRFAFSPDALYMAVTCYDSDPSGMRGTTMKRDEFLRADDRFMWVFDPFLNQQGGYFFEMNPAGLMADALMGPTGPVSREWDGIWDSYTRQSEIGWTIEIKIPFKTLNFDPDGRAWGVNFQRTVRRKNEETLWMGWGYNQGIFRIQNTGLLLGIENVSQGKGLDIRPYGLAAAAQFPGRGLPDKNEVQGGVDVYYNVTPKLRANLTVNTDFAQTEVDQRQVNLTRFSLFFPERRGFFLEGASFFDFISSTQGRFGGGANNDTAVVPFFSRRIGLGSDAQPQKIDVGARVSGQIGRQDIGVLQLRTADEGSLSGEDFTVMRLKRRMLRQSFVGMLFTRRDARGDAADGRNTLGFDYRFGTAAFRGNQNLETTGYFLHTTNPKAVDKTDAFGIALDYPNDRYAAGVSFREVQKNYDPAVGFTLRTGYRRTAPYFRFQPRPARGRNKYIRQYTFGGESDIQFSTDDNRQLLRKFDLTLFRIQMQTQDQFEVHYVPQYEYLDFAFTLAPGITLARGNEYDFNRMQWRLQTSNQRLLAVTAAYEHGGFYSGNRRQVALNLALRPRPGVTLYLESEFNRVRLLEGAFNARLFRFISDTQFSPWIQFANNVQYDSVSRVLGWQSRFRWIIQPGSDLYVVYTHNWLDDPSLNRFSTLDRRAASKIIYAIGF